jgi:hypothetical protein
MGVLESIGGFLNPGSGVLKGVKELVTVWKLPPDKQAEIEKDLLQLELQSEREWRAYELQTTEQFNTYVRELRDQIKIELSSEDAYVRRMRPTWGYATLALIIYNYTVKPDLVGGEPVEFPDLFWYIVLGINGLYWILRSVSDKTGKEQALSILKK